jgi:hypothetical protein
MCSLSQLGEVLAGDALHKVDQWFGERGVLGLLFRSGILEKAFATFNERLLSLLAVCPTSAPNCPTYHLPPAPSKPAVFGQPTMSSADWDNMLWETRMGLAAGDLVCSVCVLLEGLTTLNKALLTKIHPLLTNASVLGCLRAFVSHSQQQCLSVFSSSWLHGMYHLVKVFTALITANEECAQRDVVTLYHCVAFHLLPTLPAGAEDQLMNLLQNVVFNPLYYWEFREDAKAELLESCAGRMSMRGSAASVTGKSNKTTAEILEDGAIHLTDIQTELTRTLKKICVSEAALNKSKIQSECRILGITSLLLPTTSPILPQDWMFLPVVHLYNASIERSNESLDSSPEVVSCVHRVLQFVLLLECLRPTAMECVKVTDKFARLMCVFLAGSDLFLNVDIHSCLSSLLDAYVSPGNLHEWDSFSPSTAGVSSFHDLYTEFVSQFSAVSYGDGLFASYLLMPLQQKCTLELRRLVWGEFSHVLRLISLTENDIPVPIERFLYPVETDPEMLALYKRALGTDKLRESRSPFLYKIAIHHLDSTVGQTMSSMS